MFFHFFQKVSTESVSEKIEKNYLHLQKSHMFIYGFFELEPLKNKNRQMNITNLVLMKNQAVTKVIQMFPPKPRPGGGNAVQTAAGRRFYANCQQNGGGNI